MERSQLFDLMGELKLYGMKAAFDEIMATPARWHSLNHKQRGRTQRPSPRPKRRLARCRLQCHWHYPEARGRSHSQRIVGHLGRGQQERDLSRRWIG